VRRTIRRLGIGRGVAQGYAHARDCPANLFVLYI
jgi:hypothetical protein